MIRYRDFDIGPTSGTECIPDRQHDWCWSHKDYDGPEDFRIGTAASPDDCRAAIDEWYAEYDGASCPSCGKPYVWTGREREFVDTCPECRHGD